MASNVSKLVMKTLLYSRVREFRQIGNRNRLNFARTISSDDAGSKTIKSKQQQKLKMVPHTRSANHWHVLLNKIASKRRIEGASLDESEYSWKDHSETRVLYLGGIECYNFGSNLKTPLDEKLTRHASTIHEKVVTKLSENGYIIQDMGMGQYPDKVIELSKSFQQSVIRGIKRDNMAVILSFHPEDIPFSDAAVMVANRYSHIYAAACSGSETDSRVIMAGRSLFKTNLLVVKAHHHHHDDLTQLIDLWIRQEFKQPPRSKVGGLPDWWLSEEEMTRAINKSLELVKDINSS